MISTAEERQQPRARWRGRLSGQLRNIAPFVTLLFLVVFFSLMSPSFLSLDNFGNILRQVAVTAIIATGLTLVDHIEIDSFLKVLIRGLILLAALVINVYAQRLRTANGSDMPS